MLTQAQRAIRQTGIGSSEIAAVCGISFWGDGPHKVYLVKRGFVEAPEETIATRAGAAMERAIEPEYERAVGVRIEPLLDANDEPLTMRHPEHPWALASIDRIRAVDLIPVEIKLVMGDRAHYHRGAPDACDICGRNVSLHWGRETAAVPDDVRAQVLWQMFVTGAPWAHVARFWSARGGPEFKIHKVERCDPTIAYLVAQGYKFWHDNVLACQAPPPDSSAASEQCERQTYRSVLYGMTEAPVEARAHVDAYVAGDRMAREGERMKAEAGNWLRRLIGASEGIYGPGFQVTNRARTDGARVLKVKAKGD